MLGGVLSAVKVSLGPAAAARLPARSVAVSAAIDIPSVPSPLIPVIVTVRVLPVPLTLTVPLALPVLFSVMSFVLSVTVVPLAPS